MTGGAELSAADARTMLNIIVLVRSVAHFVD